MDSEPDQNSEQFLKWVDQINNNRLINCGKSVADYPFASCRVRIVSGTNEFKPISKNELHVTPSGGSSSGCVVYWMNRDQRVQGKYAQE